MRLGAQFFSIRKYTQDEEGLRSMFERMHEIGYETMQLSGAGPVPCEKVKEFSETYNLPILLTHTPYKRILEDTDAVIREHKVMDCPIVGLGAPNPEFRDTLEGFKALIASLQEPVKKLEAAGLSFGYHNHWFEFQKLKDSDQLAYDYMIEHCPTWKFILDTYWIAYSGYEPCDYLEKVGCAHLAPIHFKDLALKKDGTRSICSCGAGVLDFHQISDVCRKLGVQDVLVEQDNAADFGDPCDQMQLSYEYLKDIVR